MLHCGTCTPLKDCIFSRNHSIMQENCKKQEAAEKLLHPHPKHCSAHGLIEGTVCITCGANRDEERNLE